MPSVARLWVKRVDTKTCFQKGQVAGEGECWPELWLAGPAGLRWRYRDSSLGSIKYRAHSWYEEWWVISRWEDTPGHLWQQHLCRVTLACKQPAEQLVDYMQDMPTQFHGPNDSLQGPSSAVHNDYPSSVFQITNWNSQGNRTSMGRYIFYTVETMKFSHSKHEQYISV